MEQVVDKPLTAAEAAALDAYWRATNYLSVGQIYLLQNAFLTKPLRPEDIKPRLLGHWGTTPGLNILYTHLNRVIKQRDLDLMYVIGPGHGGPAIAANTWLEGSYSETYPDVPRDEHGMNHLFRQFSFPGGTPSHVAPELPGSIHEGGELGYSLSHAYGAVLPILHLNGYKIANPALLDRIGDDDELNSLLEGYGYRPYLVSGDDPELVHQQFAATLDRALDDIADIQAEAKDDPAVPRRSWPMIVLRTPKGWTGPHEVDGVQIEGTWRAHQVPLTGVRTSPEHLAMLETWMRSYRPEELFDDEGQPVPRLLDLIPDGDRRMGANPHANGGLPEVRDWHWPAQEGTPS